ncbi:sodium:proton antiporter [Acidihalobacter yilgarnensis]|uniref:Sodium:proton antiporter n=1 Tax=Acidihalobacter yilgarnensis TaxID=2819280 RepID=A0A1D8INY6_9GAMM|nr:sodium:proton antiporter [Acidihalobacter yilgarnensis]AOU98124.1 sodium:proton antiporter [Acidihalobacter yilgarnensis]
MSFFPLVSILITLAGVSSYINYRYIKLPTTIGVMLVALVASLALVLAGSYTESFREQAATLVSQVDFNQVVLHGMLAFLLFAGSIHVKLEDIGREWLPIALLAVFGTLISTCIVGGVTWLVLGWLGLGIPFLHALLFGALISPTDPIAVLGILKSAGAPRQLEVQVAGESLFNDGLGVVVFLILLELARSGGAAVSGATPLSIELGSVGILLVKEVGGALVLAMAAGYITYQMLKRVDNYQVEVLLTLSLAMGLYALADALHLSAPIAVVVAGLFIGNRGRTFAMTEKTREHVDTFWELIDEVINVVLFLLIGLELLVLPIQHEWLMAGALAIPIVLAARWLTVTGIMLPLSWVTSQSKGAIQVLTWGGLRGAISVAMALSLPAGDSRSLVLTLTYFVVVFSILVQGMTVGRVIRAVGDSSADAKSSSRL